MKRIAVVAYRWIIGLFCQKFTMGFDSWVCLWDRLESDEITIIATKRFNNEELLKRTRFIEYRVFIWPFKKKV